MAIRYPMPGSHPLVGRPAPAACHEFLHSGRGVLLDPADQFAKVGDLWSDRVDRVAQGDEPMLVRPDGYVCWAGDADELEPALGRWFGPRR
jgi:hypothetical protein